MSGSYKRTFNKVHEESSLLVHEESSSMFFLHDIGPSLDIHLFELGPQHYYQNIGVTQN